MGGVCEYCRVKDVKRDETRVLAKGRYLTLIDDNGWEYVTRAGVTGIAVIVAIMQEREREQEQRLVLVERNGRGFLESELDAVRFVPMEAGKA